MERVLEVQRAEDHFGDGRIGYVEGTREQSNAILLRSSFKSLATALSIAMWGLGAFPSFHLCTSMDRVTTHRPLVDKAAIDRVAPSIVGCQELRGRHCCCDGNPLGENRHPEESEDGKEHEDFVLGGGGSYGFGGSAVEMD